MTYITFTAHIYNVLKGFCEVYGQYILGIHFDLAFVILITILLQKLNKVRQTSGNNDSLWQTDPRDMSVYTTWKLIFKGLGL